MSLSRRLPRSTPESQGVSSAAIRAFVDEADASLDAVHSFQLVRHGHVVAEAWWAPYAADHPHMLFSLSKSFTSTAAGLAIQEGRFGLDDTVLSFFPDDAPKAPSAHLAAMRVRHLLSMSSGHGEDTLGALFPRADGNWVRGFLEAPVTHAPGTHFVYNSGATYMVSAIVQKTTGKRVLDFLGPRLFEPLGIDHPTWEQCPRGIDTGGWGLSVRTEDIACFGQLYLQKGLWKGKPLIPESWVADATRRHISNGDPSQPSDWNQGYGFQFWRCRHGGYRGDGAFGQFCVVFPEHDAVLAMTAGLGDMQAELNLAWKHLLPALGTVPLPENPAAQRALRERIGRLALRGGDGASTAPAAARVSGKSYAFAANDQKVERLEAVFDTHGLTLTVRENGVDHRIDVGHGVWRAGKTHWRQAAIGPRPAVGHEAVAARGGWTDDHTYAFQLCYAETPFVAHVVLRFGADTVTLEHRVNVAFGPTERPALEGRLTP